MNDIVISIAKILLVKNIPFCLYRSLASQQFSIAIDASIMFIESEMKFWISPFNIRPNEEIYFNVIKPESITQSLLQQIKSLTSQKLEANELPLQTTKEYYIQMVDKAIKTMQTSPLQKVVLSRVIHHALSEKFNAIDAFCKLVDVHPGALVHLSLHPSYGLWMGATPEVLIRQVGNEIDIMALAGTQALQTNNSHYHWREKEMEEHTFVCNHIEKVAAQHHLEIKKIIGPYTIETTTVAHLRTDYTFISNHNSIEKLVRDLHPTPAVGGLPVRKGVDYILHNEGYDRSYYCGFLGVTNFKDEAHLFVNLRCMNIVNGKAAIYVGGGITAASNADEEWEETILKSNTMIDILNN